MYLVRDTQSVFRRNHRVNTRIYGSKHTGSTFTEFSDYVAVYAVFQYIPRK